MRRVALARHISQPGAAVSYTTRQVQNLLTKPELELFQASRIGAIKAFNARQLVGKISRARALRDKYRDLYQRQTVRTATAPATPRKVTGTANLRTDVKADVMQEVLGRFEAQFEKVQSPPGQASKKAPAAKRAPGKATDKADIAMRGVNGTTPRQLARTQRAATDLAQEVVQSRAATPKPAAKKRATPSAATQTATTSAAKTGRTKAVAAPAKTPAKAVRATAAKKSAAASAPARRSSPKAGKKAAA